MDFVELLYWDVLSDLGSDDLGAWEVGWRANTLAGGASGEATRAASDVILRLLRENLARMIDPEDRVPIHDAEWERLMSSRDWMSARPDFMPVLSGTEKLERRLQEMPIEARDLISRGT